MDICEARPPALTVITRECNRAPWAVAGGTASGTVSQAVAAGIIAQTLWTSAAPSMTYGLYAATWHLSHAQTTLIFAVYPAAVVAVLIGGGDLAGAIGRQRTLLAGLCSAVLGALLFALANGLGMLLAARMAMGVGVALTAGPATAMLTDNGGAVAARRAALVSTVAQAGGFAAGLLMDGALIAYAPWKLRLNFWILAVLLTALLAATAALPRGPADHARHSFCPRWPAVARPRRAPFARAALAIVTAFLHGILVLSLGGQVARDLLRSPNALVNAAVLAVFAMAAGTTGLLTRRLPGRFAMRSGALAAMLGMALIVTATRDHALWIFLLASASAGIGYSLLFQGAIETVTLASPPEEHVGLLSALYLAGYLAMGSVALILGAVANVWGLGVAIEAGAMLIAVLSLGVATLPAR